MGGWEVEEAVTSTGTSTSTEVVKPAAKKGRTKADGGSKTATLPQIMEQGSVEADARSRATELLEHGTRLKSQIGEKPEPDKNKEGSGLLKELQDVKDELTMIQTTYGLEGVRHNNLVFIARLQDGRASTPMKEVVKELLARNVSIETINAAIIAATKTGDSFWVRDLEVLS